MVYRMQGVEISDKHLEIIVRQMLKKCKIEDAGDTSYASGELVDIFQFDKENEQMIREGKSRQRLRAYSLESRRLRFPQTASFRRRPSRKRRGCSPRRRSKEKWIRCWGLRRTSLSVS